MITHSPKRPVKHRPTRVRRHNASPTALASRATVARSEVQAGVQRAADNPDPEKNYNWRLTDAGVQQRKTAPWLMVTAVFGVPFVVMVILAFLI